MDLTKTSAHRVLIMVSMLLLSGLMAASAGATTASQIANLPILDPLDRTEDTLSNGGKWASIVESLGTGADTTSGWGPSIGYPYLMGAYWTPETFSDSANGSAGDAAVTTMTQGPANASRHLSLWLNMPKPNSEKSGYALKWVETATPNTYTVTLAKWIKGVQTVLATSSSVSIPAGTTLAIADLGPTISAWMGSGGTLSKVISANDTTYASGYAGMDGAGNLSRIKPFRAGNLSLAPKIEELPVLDNLQRKYENPLSNGGKWSATKGPVSYEGPSTGIVRNEYGFLGWGLDHYSGVKNPVAIWGAYWNSAQFKDTSSQAGGNSGDAVSARLTAAPLQAGQWMGIRLNMPKPAENRKGYELRFTRTETPSTYDVQILVGEEYNVIPLAEVEDVTIEVGSTLALSKRANSLTGWIGTSSLTPVLSADVSYVYYQFPEGYAAMQAGRPAPSENISGTIDNFRAGALGAL